MTTAHAVSARIEGISAVLQETMQRVQIQMQLQAQVVATSEIPDAPHCGGPRIG
jgi:hypothetical protein